MGKYPDNYSTDRQALVVYAGYKSEMTDIQCKYIAKRDCVHKSDLIVYIDH